MEEEIEIWRNISGCPGYQVSNKGRVKSLSNDKKRKEKILKPFKNNKGYFSVNLWKDGIKKNITVHRLVASAFIQNDSLFNTEINHLDENKENNCASNLEWSDRKHNCNYGNRNKKIAKAKSLFVKCLETGVVYPSSYEVQRQFGFNQASIQKCCVGKLKSAYKYHWSYVE